MKWAPIRYIKASDSARDTFSDDLCTYTNSRNLAERRSLETARGRRLYIVMNELLSCTILVFD